MNRRQSEDITHSVSHMSPFEGMISVYIFNSFSIFDGLPLLPPFFSLPIFFFFPS